MRPNSVVKFHEQRCSRPATIANVMRTEAVMRDRHFERIGLVGVGAYWLAWNRAMKWHWVDLDSR